MADSDAETVRPKPRAFEFNEDWLAVIVGLALIALVLLGAITGSLVP